MGESQESHEMTNEQKNAIERLIELAKGDSGGSRRAADFLLAWWNATECGGFDLTDLWGVSPDVAADMVTVFTLVASTHRYPDTLGYQEDFRRILAAWRPQLVSTKS